jgi:hypothetical protein
MQLSNEENTRRIYEFDEFLKNRTYRLSDDQFIEAVKFMVDTFASVVAEEDILDNLAFFPQKIHPFEVLFNTGPVLRKYKKLKKNGKINQEIKRFGNGLEDKHIERALLYLNDIASAVASFYLAAPQMLSDKDNGDIKMNKMIEFLYIMEEDYYNMLQDRYYNPEPTK